MHQETLHPRQARCTTTQHYCFMLACRSGNTNRARQQAAQKTLTHFTPCACLAAALCWYNLNPTPHPKMLLPRWPRDRAKSVPTASASVPRHFDSQASRHMPLALPLRLTRIRRYVTDIPIEPFQLQNDANKSRATSQPHSSSHEDCSHAYEMKPCQCTCSPHHCTVLRHPKQYNTALVLLCTATSTALQVSALCKHATCKPMEAG